MLKWMCIIPLLYTFTSSAFCFIEVANASRVDPLLLGSIVKQESSFNPMAQNVNRHNGNVSEDIGFAQINSSWLKNKKLKARFPDISRVKLYRDPCYNLKVSAWILLDSCDINKMDWDCIGAYNAGPQKSRAMKRKSYAKLIHAHYIEYKKNPGMMDADIALAKSRKKFKR
ncbi:lytic transglycosylase domain-containing protein [Aeromonas salmonicida]|uniref:lytic transglycosylase domain-containing protein n=1 Tax=Aeromonas salmonicida TaxID=645 RepID=UPI000B3FA659|nr:lytic transglycosylase domain-containing protein [Aeromonas salmonicida]